MPSAWTMQHDKMRFEVFRALLLKFQLFQPFVTGSDKPGQNQVAGELASPTILPLHRSLSVQSCSVLHLVTLTAIILYDVRHLQSPNVFYDPQNVSFLLQMNMHALYASNIIQ
jgi:hypothetical protein